MTLDELVKVKFGKCKPTYATRREVILRSFKYDPDSGDLTRTAVALNQKCRLGTVCRTQNANGYISVRINGETFLAHRLAYVLMTGKWPKNLVDHINGVKTDNRWENLRESTRAENGQNRISFTGASSGVRGVHWDKRNSRWKAQIQANGKRHALGSFLTKDEAVSARLKASREMHGEFSGIKFQEQQP